MPTFDPSLATRARELVHHKRTPKAAAAKRLGIGVRDVGDLLAGYRKRTEAAALERAKLAGEVRGDARVRASRDAADRERRIEKARRLILEGIEVIDIDDRLGLGRHVVGALPEAKARMAQREADEVQFRTADAALSSRSAWHHAVLTPAQRTTAKVRKREYVEASRARCLLLHYDA